MPEFQPGELKTARAPITVQPSGLSCSAELYLVSDGAKVVTSGVKVFTSTGAKQDISFSITMPSAEGTYPVYLDIFTNGLLIGAYKAIEDVVIAAPAAAEFYMPSTLNVKATGPYNGFYTVTFSTRITNKGNASGGYQLTWGSNYLQPAYEEEASKRITLAPGESYDWSWTYEEVFDYYRGYFTCWLFGAWEGDNEAKGVWR